MIRQLLVCVAVLGMAGAARAEAPADIGKPEKVKDIRKLLEASGSGKIGIQVLGAMTEQFKKMMPKVPPKFWDEFAKEAKPEELIELIVPLYDKRFSHQEVKAIIAFYDTPVGKKLVAVQPDLTQESMQVGQQWGMRLGAKVQQQLKAKGYQ